jgi:hypothetical protein
MHESGGQNLELERYFLYGHCFWIMGVLIGRCFPRVISLAAFDLTMRTGTRAFFLT